MHAETTREVTLNAGDFLQVVVHQEGLDVAVALIDENDTEIWKVDSPNDTHGPEDLVAIVNADGLYRIVVNVSYGDGHYRWGDVTQRPATDEDRQLVDGDRAYHRWRKEYRKAPWEAVAALEPLAEYWGQRELHRRRADTLVALGEAWLVLGENQKVIDACEEAATWFRVFEASHLLAPILRRAAFAYNAVGTPADALPLIDEAMDLSQKQGNQRGVFLSLVRLGKTYQQLGRPEAALQAFDQARPIKTKYATDRALLNSERASVLLDLHRADEALQDYEKALAIYQEANWTRDVAVSQDRIARAALQLGNLRYANQASLAAVDGEAAQEDLRLRSIFLLTRGRVLRRLDDTLQAGQAFQEAIRHLGESTDQKTLAVARTEAADLMLAEGRADEALREHDRALEIYQRIGDAKGEATSRVRGAEALRALGRLLDGWQRLKPALETLESLRASTHRGDYRMSFFDFRQEYYQIALRLLGDLHRKDKNAGWDVESIRVNDRRLAQELLEATRQGPEKDNALLADERRLEQNLRSLSAAEPTPARPAQIAALLNELHDVRGKMRQAGEQTPEPGPALDVKSFQKLLDDDDVVLIYALDADESRLWTLTGEKRESFSLAGADVITPAAREFLYQLQFGGDGEPGRELWRHLLTPVVSKLKSEHRLILVLDGALRNIPFSALPLPEGNDGVVLDRHEVVTLPSLAALAAWSEDRHRPRSTDGPLLTIFADPVVEDSDPRLPRARSGSGGGRLRRLPGTQAEAEAIQKLFGSAKAHVLTGFDVHQENVMERLSGQPIVHFATHATLHPYGELSGLVLSQYKADGTPTDGFLHVFEIAGRQLDADLVVLAACQTSRGEEIGGEGNLGLAWSFFRAGVPRVVASLWQVGDEKTSELMIHFYEGIRDGASPSAALRAARLAIRRQPQTEPYDWAGFVFQGDWRRPDWPQPR